MTPEKEPLCSELYVTEGKGVVGTSERYYLTGCLYFFITELLFKNIRSTSEFIKYL